MLTLIFPDKVHEEIDRVIGRHKLPMMEDQPSLPYTTAVIQEVQRYADIVPVSTPSLTSRDTELSNCVIPKVVTEKGTS